jgi:hypothetical protein
MYLFKDKIGRPISNIFSHRFFLFSKINIPHWLLSVKYFLRSHPEAPPRVSKVDPRTEEDATSFLGDFPYAYGLRRSRLSGRKQWGCPVEESVVAIGIARSVSGTIRLTSLHSSFFSQDANWQWHTYLLLRKKKTKLRSLYFGSYLFNDFLTCGCLPI